MRGNGKPVPAGAVRKGTPVGRCVSSSRDMRRVARSLAVEEKLL